MAGFSPLRFLRRLRHDRKGAIAPIFALVAVPLILAAGVGIDVSRVVSARNNLQDALDAAALALGRMPAGTSSATLQQQAQYWVNANLADKNIGAVAVSVSQGQGTIDLSAQSSIPSAVVGLMGVQTLAVAGHSQIKYGIGHVEVALVLDNTGSMVGQKMTDLKSAASSLVDSLAASAGTSSDPNIVRLSVVPYTMTVNVGSQYQTATWISGGLPSAYGADTFSVAGTNRFALFSLLGQTWGGCVESRPSPYDVTESPPTITNPGTLYVPMFAPDEPGSSNGSSTWNGQQWYNNYLSDKSNSSSWSTLQANVAKYTAPVTINSGTSPIRYQYGPNAGCAIQPLTRLTNNFNAVKTAINAMTAGGDTDIKAGLMWGWHTISPNAPFNDGVAYNTTDYSKIIVLMTDGQNHNVDTSNGDDSVYSGIGYIWQNRIGITSGTIAQRISVLDQKLGQACTNAKAAGVLIYTVVLVDTTVDQSTVRACASKPSMSYDATSSSQLSAAFGQIAGSISQLRITR